MSVLTRVGRRATALLAATVAVAGLGLATASSASAATDTDKIAFDFFVSKGLTKVQAAGIVGNLNQESGVPMNPNAIQYGGGPGRGIAQWSAGGGRWDASSASVAWYGGQIGQSRWALDTQLRFTWWELTNNSFWGLAKLRAATTIYDATKAFQDNYERCNPTYCNLSGRVSMATSAYNKYAGPVDPPGGTETALPTLRQGNSGSAVKTLQYALRGRGYTSIVVDGSFGPATNSAVRSYQSNNGLAVDGIVGANTWGSILPVLRNGSSGEAVKGLQRELVEAGYSISVDGSFGPATESAVRSYQNVNKLSVDGVVGMNTWGSLID